MRDLQPKHEKPLVYKAMLDVPDSRGILRTTDCIVPQYSGISFVQFHYPPGEYIGKSFDCWLIGVIRTPHVVKHSEFEDKCTSARTVTAGELLIIEPGAEYSAKISTRAQIDFLMLTKDRLSASLSVQHKDRLVKNASPEAYFTSHLISPLVNAILSSADRPDVFDPSHTDNFINAIVSGLCQPDPDMSAGRDRFRHGLCPRDLRNIDEYIDSAAGTAVTNAQLAALVNLPESVFRQCFKVSTGKTPYQYGLERRILLARTLLGSTGLSIAEVAYSCGFSSQSHMTDVFRSRVGATPASVRKASVGA
ncbi:AraC-type DNA-binding protein [Palleronia marisminoris]|uniref:Virulence regulon transcriptional activator VirF n=1 Tax=Palleronia marisminoris TaxID=315423 RepID=A0A1Y5TT45_9RHOB|nr:AraC family transcriptional regulator [Palleronia marisminoris]SFH55441.1 AraC-type DNA-binding protein [Palleronia marisminoris]SLN71457.1 Virulence regulon transcriptional activator VirF [Palleronia marisminoris]